MRICLALVVFASACAADTGTDPVGPEPIPEGWAELIAHDWTLPATTERYYCVRVTVPQDIDIAGFGAISPLGTHHTVLTVGDPDRPDGSAQCNTLVNHDVMLYGSGVHTNDLEFPAGVAMRVRAGQQLLLNLHLLNADTHPLTGKSGIIYKTIEPEAIQTEGEAILVGQIYGLSIDPGVSTISGTCTLTNTTSIFSIGPHMHQLGTHFRVVAQTAAHGEVVLHDDAYDFDLQILSPVIPAFEVAPGDSITTYCTYNNTTGATVTWGESSFEEMCFATLFFTTQVDQSLANCAQ